MLCVTRSLEAILPAKCVTCMMYVSFSLYGVFIVKSRFSITVPQITKLDYKDERRFYCVWIYLSSSVGEGGGGGRSAPGERFHSLCVGAFLK